MSKKTKKASKPDNDDPFKTFCDSIVEGGCSSAVLIVTSNLGHVSLRNIGNKYEIIGSMTAARDHYLDLIKKGWKDE